MNETIDELRKSLSEYIINLKDYGKIRVLGKGGYGEVYSARDKATGRKVAIKELFLQRLEGRELKMFCREIVILSKSKSQFLLSLDGFTITHPYSIVTDLIPNGSLFHTFSVKSAIKLNPTRKTIVAMCIAFGMMHLHSIGVIHRDLKSLNILLDENNYPKICDFGISRFLPDDNNPATAQIGTPHWMAPECFKNGDYTNKVDVYSYGILLWELLTESPPFKGLNAVQIMNAVCNEKMRPEIPAGTPEEFVNLLNSCWFPTPKMRPTFLQIYTLFAENKVSFPGTDRKEVEDAIEYINSTDSSKAKLRLPSIIPKFEHKQLSFGEMIEKLKECKKTTYSNLIFELIFLLDDDNINEFNETVHDILSTKIDKDILKITQNALYILLKNKPCYISAFYNKIWAKLKVVSIKNDSYFKVATIVSDSFPKCYCYDELLSLSAFFLDFSTYFITIFSNLINLYNDESHKFFDHLIRLLPYFLKSSNVNVMFKTISDFLDKYTNLVEQYKSRLVEKLKDFFSSSNDLSTVITNLHLIQKYYVIDRSFILLFLNSTDNVDSILKYLIEVDSFAVDKEIINKLINIGKINRLAFLSLFNLLKDENNFSTFFQEKFSWQGLGSSNIFYLFSAVISSSKSAALLLSSDIAYDVFVEEFKNEVLQSSSTVVSIVISAKPSVDVIKKMIDHKFLQLFKKYCLRRNEKEDFDTVYNHLSPYIESSDIKLDI